MSTCLVSSKRGLKPSEIVALFHSDWKASAHPLKTDQGSSTAGFRTFKNEGFLCCVVTHQSQQSNKDVMVMKVYIGGDARDICQGDRQYRQDTCFLLSKSIVTLLQRRTQRQLLLSTWTVSWRCPLFLLITKPEVNCFYVHLLRRAYRDCR